MSRFTIADANKAITEGLALLDGLHDLLRLLEEVPEKPDLPNSTLRPILATIQRAAGHVSTGMDMLDQIEAGVPS